MGFWNNFTNKKKDTKNGQLVNSYDFGQATSLRSYLGKESQLTEEQLMGIPAVEAAVNLISNSIASLPLKLYKRNESGDLIEVKDSRQSLLNDEPNESLSGYALKRKIVKDILFYGTSKTVIERKSETSNEISGLYPLEPKDITIDVYLINNYRRYGIVNLTGDGGHASFYNDVMLSVLRDSDDGIVGTGVIENNENIFKLALAQIEYEKNLLENGAMPTSVLESDSKLNDVQINRLRSAWETMYEKTKNAGKTIILESGLKYRPASYNPDDMQMESGKKSITSNIAQIFNIPEPMINSASNKYDSSEQNNLYFLQYTLSPLMTLIENSFTKGLLLESEKESGYMWRFDETELLRTTEDMTSKRIITQYNAGLRTNIEAMKALGIKTSDDMGEYTKLTTGEVLLYKNSKDIINPNTGVKLNVDTLPTQEEMISLQANASRTPNDINKDSQNKNISQGNEVNE